MLETTMSLPTSDCSPPKRPRLSLQTKNNSTSIPIDKNLTALRATLDMTSPTAFNTLSNAYAAAIELASPQAGSPITALEPKTAINTARPTSLRLVTDACSQGRLLYPSQRTQTPGPYTVTYPDTPSTLCSASTPTSAHPEPLSTTTPIFTFTPPQSAHPIDSAQTYNFSYLSSLSCLSSPTSPRTPRRRATTGSQSPAAPYTHPRSLRSILRNSPLPPRSVTSPVSPRRASQRLADRAAKRVCYNNPLTQTIINNKYTKSHVDLLAEEASPYSPIDTEAGTLETLDLTLAYTGNETRDGGQTPGPFEEMRRRMAGLDAAPKTATPVIKKRKRKEKKRRWEWTIGANGDEIDGEKTPTSLQPLPELLKPTVYVDTPRDEEMPDRPDAELSF